MTTLLQTTYEKLGLRDPLEWEDTILGIRGISKPAFPLIDRIGSTTQMAIEAVLDYHCLPDEIPHRVLVVVDSLRKVEKDFVGDLLYSVAGILGVEEYMGKEIRFVKGMPETCMLDVADLVYLDHYLVNKNVRLTGAMRLVRIIEPSDTTPGAVRLLDRARNLVMEAHGAEVEKLLRLSPSPIYDGRDNTIRCQLKGARGL